MDNSREMLGKEPVKKLLIKLSTPAIIGMLVSAFYNLTDTAFVGKSSQGVNALNALAVAFPIQNILMAITLMLAAGSGAIYSIALGEKNYEKIKSTIGTVFLSGIIIATIIAIVGNLFMEEILAIFSTPESVVPIAKDYLSIIFISNIGFICVSIGNSLLRGEGNSRYSMNTMIIGTIINIILDPIFIYDFGFGLGVKGAAIATFIGQTASLLYFIYVSKTKNTMIKFYKKHLKIDWEIFVDICKVGFPSFTRNFMGSMVSVIMFYYLSLYGAMSGIPNGVELAQSIYGTINKTTMFLFMPSFGIIQGMQPIIGYNYGAGKYDRIREVMSLGFKIMFIYFTIAWIAIMLIPNYILMIFANEAMFINIGKNILRIQLCVVPLVTLQIIPSVYFQSLQRPIESFVIAASRQLIFLIPAIFIIPMFFQNEMKIYGLFLAFPVADLISVIFSYFIYKNGLKMLEK